MGHREGFSFCERQLSRELLAGLDVIEVGSSEDGGSMRPYVSSFGPKSYIGVDIQKARGVDLLCDAMDLLDVLGKNCCDVVIASELLEHIRDWRKIIHIFKTLLREGGVVVITTRSYGFPFHYAPFDFWRYEPSDMQAIFSDFEIMGIETDTQMINDRITPGVFVAAKKPIGFSENNLDGINLYSILKDRRVHEISDYDIIMYEILNLGLSYFLKHNGLPFLVRDALSKYVLRPWRNRTFST